MDASSQFPQPAQERFEMAWKTVRNQLFRRAQRLTRGNASHSDDLLANTALKAYLYLLNSSEQVRDAQGFLFMVLDHVFLDSVRKIVREKKIIDHDTDLDHDHAISIASQVHPPEKALELRQQIAQLELNLTRLTPEQRFLFTLKFEQELAYPDIASILCINEALARKRVELLRKKLISLTPNYSS
jgi:RNA polymerase sigma factor (sigma-70 family)